MRSTTARFFVLLASPDAAASEWVNKEVEHWREVHGVDTILPVLTDGTWEWNDAEAGIHSPFDCGSDRATRCFH